jgi:alkyl hydroperoxide reductase subunit AhpC
LDKSVALTVFTAVKKFQKYYEKNLELEVVYIGSILDPHYKNSIIKNFSKREDENLKEYTIKIINDITHHLKEGMDQNSPRSKETVPQ